MAVGYFKSNVLWPRPPSLLPLHDVRSTFHPETFPLSNPPPHTPSRIGGSPTEVSHRKEGSATAVTHRKQAYASGEGVGEGVGGGRGEGEEGLEGAKNSTIARLLTRRRRH